MPPKPKFKKEEIIEAAVEIVSQKGINALTAQELRTALQCSASPIFTVFNSMKEISDEVRIAVMRRFENFNVDNSHEMPIFKQIGIKMIMFGIKEPKFFQLLFMQESEQSFNFENVFERLGNTAEFCITAIEKDYGLTPSQAEILFKNVWIYTFGIGALCATKACIFSEKELSQMLTTEFSAMMMLLKNNENIDQ